MKRARKALALVFAAAAVLAFLPTTAFARWALFQSITPSLSFSSNKAQADVVVRAQPGADSVSATIYLCEEQPGGIYYQVYKWPEQKRAGNYLSFTGSCPATPGKTYRLYIEATAKKGSQSEFVSVYTQRAY